MAYQWSDSNQSGSLATNIFTEALISYEIIARESQAQRKKHSFSSLAAVESFGNCCNVPCQ